MKKTLISLVSIATLGISSVAFADCNTLPTRAELIAAAKAVVPGDTYLVGDVTTPNGGFDLPMWVTLIDTTGTVCHVINTGLEGQSLFPDAYVGNQSWLGSRVISAQKANTANAFSLDYYAISTANLFGATQTNNSLFGLQLSNPVDTRKAYSGNPDEYGTINDPMIGKRVGGVNVFGGGLALYSDGVKVGAIGVSGDTSCTDHTVAWKIRAALSLHAVPRGPIKEGDMFNTSGGTLSLVAHGSLGDEMYIDVDKIGQADASGWEHPACPNTPDSTKNDGAIVGNLP